MDIATGFQAQLLVIFAFLCGAIPLLAAPQFFVQRPVIMWTIFLASCSLALLSSFNWTLLIFVLGLFSILTLEDYFPRHRQEPNAETPLTAGYMLFKRLLGVSIYFAFLGAGLTKSEYHGLLSNLSPSWQIAAAVLLIDFKTYVYHRSQHHFPRLWRFHRVHHYTTVLQATAFGRSHIFDYGVQITLGWLVALLLGMNPLLAVGSYSTVHLVIADLFAHSNLDFPGRRLRFLSFIIATPNAHAIHHGTTSDRYNFGGVFMIWDIIFGTFKRPDEIKVERYGVLNANPPVGFLSDQFGIGAPGGDRLGT